MTTSRPAALAWTFDWWQRWDDAWGGPLGATWRELANTSSEANAFHEPALCRVWAETVGKATGTIPVLGLATAGDGTRAVLPWVLATHEGRRVSRRVLEPIGQTQFGYHDPLLSAPVSDGTARALWKSARTSLPVRADAALFRFVHEGTARGPLTEPLGEDSPVLELEGVRDYDTLLAGLSRNAREQLRRARRKLEAAGSVQLSLFSRETAAKAAEEYRDYVVPSYRAVWRPRPAGCLLDLPGVEYFFERLVEVGVAEGWAQLARLTVDGKPVAWHVGLVHRTGWYWWLPAYDPAHAEQSPGAVLMAELIARAIAERVPRLHLMVGAHEYKLRWRPSSLALRSVRWYAPGVRGTSIRLYDALRRPGAATTPRGPDLEERADA